MPEVDLVVIVDVLSFSTAVSVACTRGAIVLPHSFDEAAAAELAARHGATLAVRREEASAEHPLSLSPVSMLQARPGERIVLPSPNGAPLSLAAATAGVTVVAGCLRNAGAVADHAADRRVAVIAAGERWPDGSLRPAVEDLLGAGAIIAAVGGRRSAEAEVAAAVAAADPAPLVRDSISGRELVERGAAADVDLAVAVDADQAVPVLADGAYVAAP